MTSTTTAIPAELPANPPAFARPTSDVPGQPGMTLRDYFAAAALTGYIAGHAGDASIKFPKDADAAKNAYDLADAMLARRGAK